MRHEQRYLKRYWTKRPDHLYAALRYCALAIPTNRLRAGYHWLERYARTHP